ncbi:MAG: M24 family metallopeptidase [Spirochaetaceae bacterium]|nr:M24 family metallopeptidase [Spirochaetaceae bacterium]
MKACLNNGHAGMMEVQWSASATDRMRNLGAHALTFDPIIQSGIRMNTSIGKTYNKIVQEGEIISIGIGCRYKSYAGHVCRSTIVGKGSPEQKTFLRMGAEACKEAGLAVQYNTPMSNMDKASHRVFQKYGYSQYDTSSCGHGTGFTDGVGEGAATQKTTGLWPKNIVMMADVSLSNVPNLYGFRFEDGFLIDNDGNTIVLTEGINLEL